MICEKNVAFGTRMLLFLLKNEGYSPMHEVVPARGRRISVRLPCHGAFYSPSAAGYERTLWNFVYSVVNHPTLQR